MTNFDKLDQVRELARARAQEDFEYLCNNVLGLALPPSVCDLSQGDGGIELSPGRLIALRKAQQTWLYLQGRAERPLHLPETFEWLFGRNEQREEYAA